MTWMVEWVFISHFVTAPARSGIVHAATAHVHRATAGWSLPLAVGGQKVGANSSDMATDVVKKLHFINFSSSLAILEEFVPTF